jgi:CBS domain-containing protein
LLLGKVLLLGRFLLLIGNFNGLPVINSSIKVIGIVTAVDILRAIRQGKNLDSIRAVDIMTRNPVVVKEDTEIKEVIDIILQRHIILVPVINDQHLPCGPSSRASGGSLGESKGLGGASGATTGAGTAVQSGSNVGGVDRDLFCKTGAIPPICK